MIKNESNECRIRQQEENEEWYRKSTASYLKSNLLDLVGICEEIL